TLTRASGQHRRDRLAAGQPVFIAGEYCAHRYLRGAYRVDCAAFAALFLLRCRLDGRRSGSLPAVRTEPGTWGVLGLHSRLVLILHLRLLSAGRTLARRSLLLFARVRNYLAGLAWRAAPRHRRDLFLYRSADPVLCSLKRHADYRSTRRADLDVGRHSRNHCRGDGGYRGLAAARY